MSEAERTIETPEEPEPVAEDPGDAVREDDSAPAEEAGRDEPATPVARGPRRVGVLVMVAGLAYLLDLATKIWVVDYLENPDPNREIEVIGEWLRFVAVRNPGAAFGFGETLTVVLTCVATAVIVVIIRLARKLYSAPWAVALGLLLGGALGNLTDRLLRSPGVFEGHVVDFIAPKHFAVFNLADSAIVCGGILIVLLSFRGLDPDGTVHRD
ncbi:signal peptidase II [Streptomyces sp. 3MP-14]|uniref:Lipoprotein signal peptidase n=1 Tax=Streptomyces mimosae TaxID=2586635 RepID=A0A5N6ALB1_9ACTN|nr:MULTISPECIES: signal peptidase II [Streptomyces]KAB8168680.1 signal peptidase II [Streptomyces mimosae]KAB8178040.1 signal peptidase II [Streptomyces sp. 3MP-14]